MILINTLDNAELIIFLWPLKKGPVAEWLGSALQKLLQRFESARDLWKLYRILSKVLKTPVKSGVFCWNDISLSKKQSDLYLSGYKRT